jgi:hypothetical protein
MKCLTRNFCQNRHLVLKRYDIRFCIMTVSTHKVIPSGERLNLLWLLLKAAFHFRPTTLCSALPPGEESDVEHAHDEETNTT